MGAGCCTAKEVQYFDLSQLNFLDLCLFRTSKDVNGYCVEQRVFKSIVQGAEGQVRIDRTFSMNKYDRVGIIQVPSLPRNEYTLDNISVTQCTAEGVKTSKLREIQEMSLNVAIRPLQISRNHNAERKASSRAALAQLQSAYEAEAKKKRASWLNKYFELAATVIAKPPKPLYSVQSGQLVPLEMLATMFGYMKAVAISYCFSSEMDAKMTRLIDEKAGVEDISFDCLLEIMHSSDEHNVPNRFTQNDMFYLTRTFGEGQLRQIPKDKLMREWKDVILKYNISRKIIAEALSGAFVSQIYQQCDIFPKSPAFYFLPFEFASQPGTHPSYAPGDLPDEDDDGPEDPIAAARLGRAAASVRDDLHFGPEVPLAPLIFTPSIKTEMQEVLESMNQKS
jgi:hypothetical protein